MRGSREIEFYRDAEGQVRWRYWAANGSDILADSGQGYSRVVDAVSSAHIVTGGQRRIFTGLGTERFAAGDVTLSDLEGNYGEATR